MALSFDLHIAKLPIAETYGSKLFSFSSSHTNNETILVSGIYSVINKWLMFLLTPRYSDPIDLEYGTMFHELINGVGSQEELFSSVQIAVQEASAGLRRIQRGVLLDASQMFKDAILTGIKINSTNDGYDLYISISNLTGDKITVTLPTLLETL